MSGFNVVPTSERHFSWFKDKSSTRVLRRSRILVMASEPSVRCCSESLGELWKISSKGASYVALGVRLRPFDHCTARWRRSSGCGGRSSRAGSGKQTSGNSARQLNGLSKLLPRERPPSTARVEGPEPEWNESATKKRKKHRGRGSPSVFWQFLCRGVDTSIYSSLVTHGKRLRHCY